MGKKNKKSLTDNVAIWVAMATSIVAVIISGFSLYHTYQLENEKETENILLSVNRVFDDYATQLFPFSNRGAPSGALSVYWDVLVSNNGQSPISIIDYDITVLSAPNRIVDYSGLNDGLYNTEMDEVGLPVVIDPGHAKRFYLKSRILLHSKAVMEAINPEQENRHESINGLLSKLYMSGTDFYGNKVIVPRKNIEYAIVSPEKRKEQVFIVTLKTAKGGQEQDFVSWYNHSGISK
ncbi:MAG: hypothetical protein ACRBEE_11780 [Arenicella sp.]